LTLGFLNLGFICYLDSDFWNLFVVWILAFGIWAMGLRRSARNDGKGRITVTQKVKLSQS
jgi:hypothetical protein